MKLIPARCAICHEVFVLGIKISFLVLDDETVLTVHTTCGTEKVRNKK